MTDDGPRGVPRAVSEGVCMKVDVLRMVWSFGQVVIVGVVWWACTQWLVPTKGAKKKPVVGNNCKESKE